MRKLVLVAFAITLFVNKLFSQDDKKISFGVKAGINFATITNLTSETFGITNASISHPTRVLPFTGVYSVLKLTSIVSFQPELLISMKGYNYKSNNIYGNNSLILTQHTTLSYLDIPLQMRFNMGKGFHILAGPSVGFLLASSTKIKKEAINGGTTQTATITDHSTSELNTVDLGMYLGLGYQLNNGLNFGLRWNRGFTNVYKNSESQQNSVFQLSIGYAF